MSPDKPRPLTLAEIAWRRRGIMQAASCYPSGRNANVLAAMLEKDIAERGCEPITNAMREFQTRTGGTLHLIAGDKPDAPKVSFRLRSTPTGPDDGPRAA